MIKGAETLRSKSGGVVVHYGKWAGKDVPANGLYAPIAPSAALGTGGAGAVCRGLTLTRTGAGLYTVAFVDGSVPHIFPCDFNVVSDVPQNVYILTKNAATGTITISIVLASNVATASDPDSADVIEAVVPASEQGQP